MIMTIAQNISEKELLELYGLPLDELLSEAKKI